MGTERPECLSVVILFYFLLFSYCSLKPHIVLRAFDELFINILCLPLGHAICDVYESRVGAHKTACENVDNRTCFIGYYTAQTPHRRVNISAPFHSSVSAVLPDQVRTILLT